jgi:hypothetical protein
MHLAASCRYCLATALALLFAGQILAQEPGRQDFPKMKYGFFVHYVWNSPDNPVYYPETVNPDGSLPSGLDDLADRFDATGFANDLASMRVQYVFFTAWHANMNCLWPSPVMNRWLTGHTSKRDVLRDMITAVKAKGIKVFFYTQAWEGYTLTAVDQAATGWGPIFDLSKWNDFTFALYGELISRYGNDIEGLMFDGDVADPRLLDAVRAANTNLVIIRNGPRSNLYDCSFLENNWFYAAGTNAWSAPDRPSSIVMGSTCWSSVPATVANAAKYPPAAIFRYTVLMAGVSNSAGGAAWAAGPYPGGGWEPGVLTTMQAVGAYIAPVGRSILNTYASTAYVTPADATIDSLQRGVVATRSTDDAYEYIHVLTPPTGNTLILPPPADRKVFASAQLLANGQPVTLAQNSAGVRLSLQGTNAWNGVDTVIALTVAGVAPNASLFDVSAPILSPPASQSAIPGQNVSFNVYAGSATPPTYRWQAGAVGSGVYTNLVNGGQISGATSNILTIHNVTTNWALDYVVIVANSSGSVTSAPPTTLTMQFLPVITTPPASQGAVASQTVSFSVTASGTGFQWQAGPAGGPYTNLVDGPQIGGSTTSTLTISNVTTDWLLAYQVEVTAPYGSITSTPPALLTYIQTNYLDFSATTVDSWSGPVSPANGVTSFSGAGLNVGDRVVFDGLVMYTNTNDLSACLAWGAVDLNQGGDAGMWGAALGALARLSSLSSDYPCFLWVNGFGPGGFPGTIGNLTNRVRIELTATAAGSTANMKYLVEIDQGLTGTFNSSMSGAGVCFSGNTITLTFNVGFCAPDSAEFINYHTPPWSISGTVMNQSGLGLAHSVVYFSSTPNASANPVGSAVTDSSGNFMLPIFNGTWYACAAASNYVTSADQMVTMHSSNVANFDFRLAAPRNPALTGFKANPAGTGFILSGNTDVAGKVVVWATTSLAPPIIWVTIQTNEVPAGGFSITVPGTNSQAFYRLMDQ